MPPLTLHPDHKIAGILAPLFALRGTTDHGTGDVAALAELVVWASSIGLRMIQLLPINETGSDHSPYNAISSVALEPATLALTPAQLRWLDPADYQRLFALHHIADLRLGPVQYPRVKSFARDVLRAAFERFERVADEPARREFALFCEVERTWLDAYAYFRVLMDRHGHERWTEWPAEHRNLTAARQWEWSLAECDRRLFEHERRFVSWMQWIAAEQWRAAKIHATERGVALMGDIPFGVNFFSADVWAAPELFDQTWSGGCPPEWMAPEGSFMRRWGQSWGIPLYRWAEHRAQDYAWWRQRVAKVRDVFHLFRVDHILGFFRIYGFPWRPERNEEFCPLSDEEAAARTGGHLPRWCERDDHSEENQRLNRAQGESILRVLCEEAGPHRLIGEDLGCVPPYVRPCLADLGIAGFKIPHWDSRWDGSLQPACEYPRLSVATYATHDTDPLAALWLGWMKQITLALHGGPETYGPRDHAWFESRRLAGWAGFEVPHITPFDDHVWEKFTRALFASESWIAVLMITDLFSSTQRFNEPGSVSKDNWTERLPRPIAHWLTDPTLSARAQHAATLIRETGRAGSV